jgi:hypothetical protein
VTRTLTYVDRRYDDTIARYHRQHGIHIALDGWDIGKTSLNRQGEGRTEKLHHSTAFEGSTELILGGVDRTAVEVTSHTGNRMWRR